MNFIIDLYIFNHELMVSIDETDAQFARSVTKRYGRETYESLFDFDQSTISDKEEFVGGRTYHHAKWGNTIVRIKKRPNDPTTIGLVAHEVFHATEYILDRVGVERTHSETWAYTLEYITRQIFERLK